MYKSTNFEKIFSNICRTAKILRSVSVHSLRHSFVTHLLESGIDLGYMQEVLGHKSGNITEVYIRVSNKKHRKVKSSLDDSNTGQKRR